MRIGSSFQLPALPPRSGNTGVVDFEKPEQQPHPENTRQPIPDVVLSDLIQAAEQSAQTRDETRFYTMDRDLPLRGQEALSAYLTTAQLNIPSDNAAQLVGVDIYV